MSEAYRIAAFDILKQRTAAAPLQLKAGGARRP
jgi:hypothetical protein